MSASLTLSSLSWSTPDGHQVFSNLTLQFGSERCGLVGRNGTGKTTLLRLITGELSPVHGTISVAGRLAWLRQNISKEHGETIADLFCARPMLAQIERAVEGLASAEELAETDWELPARMEAALARLGLDCPFDTMLSRLSGGQRTRAGLAALILDEPDFLLLDEPTNNLDRPGRQAVLDLLHGWKKGALVVSHDRELLEQMDSIVELTTLGASRYGGNYSHYKQQKAEELARSEQNLAHARKEQVELNRKMQLVRERKERKDSAGHKRRAKRDQPKIALDAMKQRSQSSAGAQKRLHMALADETAQTISDAQAKIEVLTPLTIDLPSTGLSSDAQVLTISALTGGHNPADPVLQDFSIKMRGAERIAVTGANGSGKSTLLALITGHLAPSSGDIIRHVAHAFVDQHISLLDPACSIVDNYKRLNPASDDNACRAALARFMFRADAALKKVSSLSGGECLRAGLACTLGSTPPPSLLILDEPTNHLDLDTLDVLEAALSAYDGALLVVSHDENFLDAIGITRRISLPPGK